MWYGEVGTLARARERYGQLVFGTRWEAAVLREKHQSVKTTNGEVKQVW
jgi:hypothetical protein